jgi:hypothetical protein
MKKRYEYRLREPYANPQGRGAPPAVYRRSVESRMIIERDVAVSCVTACASLSIFTDRKTNNRRRR